MKITEEVNLNKDHARWESEHGHWLKDIEIWYQRHRDAQDLIDAMAASLKLFSAEVEAHKSSIKHHRDVVKIHEAALAWHKDHPAKHGEAKDQAMHKFQEEVHLNEGQVHRRLLELHQEVANDIMKLAHKFGLTL